MSKNDLNWNSIAKQIGDNKHVDVQVKKQIEELVLHESKDRVKKSA